MQKPVLHSSVCHLHLAVIVSPKSHDLEALYDLDPKSNDVFFLVNESPTHWMEQLQFLQMYVT